MHARGGNTFSRDTWDHAPGEQEKDVKVRFYIGITKGYLLVAECEERRYLSELYSVPDRRTTVAEDVGTCFPLTEILSCEVKKGIMGAVNCSVTLKNGGFLKLQLPKLGGLGGGMPHHGVYREKIIDCLRGL